jgi:hypothetical protein
MKGGENMPRTIKEMVRDIRRISVHSGKPICFINFTYMREEIAERSRIEDGIIEKLNDNLDPYRISIRRTCKNLMIVNEHYAFEGNYIKKVEAEKYRSKVIR